MKNLNMVQQLLAVAAMSGHVGKGLQHEVTSKNPTHVAAWLLAFALWGVGYYMLDRSAFWLLLCFAGVVVALIAVFMNEPSPKLSEEEKRQDAACRG